MAYAGKSYAICTFACTWVWNHCFDQTVNEEMMGQLSEPSISALLSLLQNEGVLFVKGVKCLNSDCNAVSANWFLFMFMHIDCRILLWAQYRRSDFVLKWYQRLMTSVDGVTHIPWIDCLNAHPACWLYWPASSPGCTTQSDFEFPDILQRTVKTDRYRYYFYFHSLDHDLKFSSFAFILGKSVRNDAYCEISSKFLFCVPAWFSVFGRGSLSIQCRIGWWNMDLSW